MDFIKRCIQQVSQTFQGFLQNRQAQLIITLYALIILIFLGTFIRTDYATDTYADLMLPARELIANFLRGGRLVTLLFFIILRGLHVPIQIVSLASFILALLSLVASLYILYVIIRKTLVRHTAWAFILSLLIILNPFIIELFLFIEKGIMALGILSCIVAVYFFNKHLETKQWIPLVSAASLVIFATFCYQGIVGLFIVLSTLIVVFRSKQWSTFVRNTFYSVVIYAIGPIVNVVFIKLFSSGGRTDGAIIISESIQKIFAGMQSMFGFFEIIPSSCYWLGLATIIIAWLIFSLCRRQLFCKTALLTIAQIFYLFLVICLAALAPQIAQSTASIWIAPRSTYVFASLLSVVLIIVIHNYPALIRAKWWSYLIGCIISLLLLVQFFGFNRIITSRYSLNAIDRLRALQLGQLIQDYEAEHNTTITKIMPANDQYLSYSYPGIFTRGDINVSAFSTDWSDVTSLSYWNQRYFERVDASPEWQSYCNSRNWGDFDISQLQFTSDTLQICWY